MEYLSQANQQAVILALIIPCWIDTYNVALQLGIPMGSMNAQLILCRSKACQLVVMM